MDSWQLDPVYNKLQDIRRDCYKTHPLFEFLRNKDASVYLKAKVREKQFDIAHCRIDHEQWHRFNKGTVEDILYELLEEMRIADAEDILAKAINEDIDQAQELLKKL